MTIKIEMAITKRRSNNENIEITIKGNADKGKKKEMKPKLQ